MSNATTLDLARAALRRAKRWLQGARRALEDGRWDDAVYASQMAVEHSAKGVLIALGIEFPKVHDVSPVLRLLPPGESCPLEPLELEAEQDVALVWGSTTPHFNPWNWIKVLSNASRLLASDGLLLYDEYDRIHAIFYLTGYKDLLLERV
ncbi:MAG: HEPN domain-containing protein [Thermofilaceae archaeon]